MFQWLTKRLKKPSPTVPPQYQAHEVWELLRAILVIDRDLQQMEWLHQHGVHQPDKERRRALD